jgi:hypothetical protein
MLRGINGSPKKEVRGKGNIFRINDSEIPYSIKCSDILYSTEKYSSVVCCTRFACMLVSDRKKYRACF